MIVSRIVTLGTLATLAFLTPPLGARSALGQPPSFPLAAMESATIGTTLSDLSPALDCTGPNYLASNSIDDVIADVVQARSSNRYFVRIKAGEWSQIGVKGDGDTDLDLFVFDEFDNLVASDIDLSDECLIEFSTWRTQTYRIEVRNLGGVYNAFMMGID